MGGKVLLKDPQFKSQLVTKQQYEEYGMSAIQEKFNQWSTIEIEEPVQSKPKIEPISYIDHIKKYDVFGKGIVEERNEDNKSDNTDASRKCEEEIDVSGKEEEKSVIVDEDKSKIEVPRNVKFIKKSTRNSASPIYTYKLVSPVTKST